MGLARHTLKGVLVMSRHIFNAVKPLFDAGNTHEQITSTLNSLGVKTVQGKTWTQKNVSNYLISHGFRRTRKRRKKNVYKATQVTVAKKVKAPTESAEHTTILDVMTSNLSDALKVKVIKALL
jgi:hypothetical protein